MKNEVVYLGNARISMMLIFAVLMMVASSCTKSGNPVYDIPESSKTFYFELKPEGVSGETMEGNLLIDAPPGAVSEPLTISIKKGPEEDHNGFLLKSVKISPIFLSYNKPLKVSFKFNGELLSNGITPGNGILELYCFSTEKVYEEIGVDNIEPMCKCTLNPKEETIEAYICKNGIFGILEK